MPYKTGEWGNEAKARSKRRREYFLEYRKTHPSKSCYKRSFKGFGSLGEIIGLKIFEGSVLVRRPNFDITWKDKKIEIKIATLQNKRNRWTFSTGRQKGKTDYFLLIGMDKDRKNIVKIYFIPDNVMDNRKYTTLGMRSKRFKEFRMEVNF